MAGPGNAITTTPTAGPAIRPLTPERWGDFERLFGPNGACAGCWCMWWRRPRAAFDAGKGPGNRAAFAARVAAGPPPGVLAYDAAETAGGAVGWCAVAPRAELPVLNRSRLLRPVDDRPVWSINCLFVKPGQRRRGLSRPLIAGAIDLARRAGATLVEAYPWDREGRQASGTIYTGVVSTFRALGFVEVARRAPHRPIMRLPLSGVPPAAGSAL